MSTPLQIDSSILQFTPKGEFYSTEDEKMTAYVETVDSFFKFNRQLFALISLLPGTAYSHGMFAHKLLSNPQTNSVDLVKLGVDHDFETKIILFALRRETQPRALKNLLMLAGKKGFTPINNARTRKIILSYIFDRSAGSLDLLVTKYKNKIATLVRHAIGIQHLTTLLNDKTGVEYRIQLYDKHIGRYFIDGNALPIIFHLFGVEYTSKQIPIDEEDQNIILFPKIQAYKNLKESATADDTIAFAEILKSGQLPVEVGIGFRNTYKLDIKLAEIIDAGKKSGRQAIQMQTAAKKAGTTIDVDYKSQDLYDLWKLFYAELAKDNSDLEIMSSCMEAIETKKVPDLPFDFGKTVLILDQSKSMMGSQTRKLHPFLTGLCLASRISADDVIIVGGDSVETGMKEYPKARIPAGATNLVTAYVEALKLEPDTVVIVSDGYENEVKGGFQLFYDKFKETIPHEVVHINPVYAPEVSGLRQLAPDIKAISGSNYKTVENSMIFDLLTSHPNQVLALLVSKFKNLQTSEEQLHE